MTHSTLWSLKFQIYHFGHSTITLSITFVTQGEFYLTLITSPNHSNTYLSIFHNWLDENIINIVANNFFLMKKINKVTKVIDSVIVE